MADLDEFFAKKDKRRSKSKKFATVEETAKKLEESRKRMEKLKQEKLLALQLKKEVNNHRNTIQDDDEWKEFEEEKKDYSGLKIHNLTLSDYNGKDEELPGGKGDDEKEIDENKTNEEVPKMKKEPWKSIPNLAKGDEKQQTQFKSPLMQSNAFYIPSSLKGAAKLQSPNLAPDVKNEELFPTLSAATRRNKKVKDDYKRKANSRIDQVKNSKSHKTKYKPPHASARK